MLTFSKKCKVSKVVGKDVTRLALNRAEVVAGPNGPELHATDSFMAVRIPLSGEISAPDALGPVSLQAIIAAEKVGQFEPTADSINVTGVIYQRPDMGQFPNLDQVWPPSDSTTIILDVVLDAKRLHMLANALGEDVVRLQFSDPLKPIQVETVNGRGLLMPQRRKSK